VLLPACRLPLTGARAERRERQFIASSQPIPLQRIGGSVDGCVTRCGLWSPGIAASGGRLACLCFGSARPLAGRAAGQRRSNLGGQDGAAGVAGLVGARGHDRATAACWRPRTNRAGAPPPHDEVHAAGTRGAHARSTSAAVQCGSSGGAGGEGEGEEQGGAAHSARGAAQPPPRPHQPRAAATGQQRPGRRPAGGSGRVLIMVAWLIDYKLGDTRAR
jgi:hypothetical protein